MTAWTTNGSATRILTMLATALALTVAAGGTASAQGVCDSGKKIFEDRAAIISRINGWGKKQVDPNTACTTFTQLQANGANALKFLTENQSWCRIPQDAITSIEQQQKQVGTSRAQACKVAAEFNKAKRQAEAAAQSGGNSAFAGPDDVSGGARRVPQGAL